MRKIILSSIILTLATQFSFAAVPDSIKAMVADFDSIVQVAEKDYAAFKFKVTDVNRKEYKAFKKSLINDIKKQKRTWQDAVCAYVGWFGDFHFGVYGNNEIAANYFKYARKFMTQGQVYDTSKVEMTDTSPLPSFIEIEIKEIS